MLTKAFDMRKRVLAFKNDTAECCESPEEMYEMIEGYEALVDELIKYFDKMLENN